MEAATPINHPDPLIDEIRRIRTELHQKFPNDLKAYVDYINQTATDSLRSAGPPSQNVPPTNSPH
jgi:hypothetical protein